MLWLAIGVSIVMVSDKAWLVSLLAIIMVGVTVYLLRLKTVTADMLRGASAGSID
jgi:hypothetical protein